MTQKTNLTFLGTGSAIPTARRNHPAVLLQYKDENILVDCGEATQRQFRYAKLNPCKITRILITHWHADHVLGIPGLLQTLMLNGYNKTLKIYGPSGTKKMMQLYIGLFAHKGEKFPIEVYEISNSTITKQNFGQCNTKDLTMGGRAFKSRVSRGGGWDNINQRDLGASRAGTFPNTNKHLNENTIINTKEFQIKAKPMDHDTPTLAYSFTIKEKNRIDKQKLKQLKLPEKSQIVGQLAQGKSIKFNGKTINPKSLLYKEPQRKITIIMDTLFNKDAIQLAKDSDLLICESTYSHEDEQLAKEHKHLTSTQAAEIAKKSQSKKLILTHLSQRNEANPKQILQEAGKVFKNSEVVKDLDKTEI